MSAQATASGALQVDVGRYPWYHTRELGEGVKTKGMFRSPPVLDRYPIPADLSGKRAWTSPRWTVTGHSRWSAAAPPP